MVVFTEMGEDLGKSEFCGLIKIYLGNLPAMQQTPVRFLGQEDPLEKG